jgi:signal peptidase I
MQLIVVILWIVITRIGLYKMFEKAGEAGWKALVPIYNKLVWADIIGRPRWRVALLLIPIVNIFVLVGMVIDLVNSFSKWDFFDHTLAVVATPAYFCYLGFSKDEKYLYKAYEYEKENPSPKGQIREWAEAIIFAVFAATFIRMFLIEAYTIPTPSMEGSLLVGDFLFVSKAHYGMRMPMTPAQFPLVHNTLPVVGGESYIEAVKFPYYRTPKIQPVKRNEPVVFNFPEGDTIVYAKKRSVDRGINNYYSYLRDYGFKRETLLNPANYKLVTRPIDKRDNYIKRCVGIPGDSLEVRQGQLYINGEKAQNPEKIQHSYNVTTTDGASLHRETLISWGVNEDDIIRSQMSGGLENIYNLTEEQAEKIKSLSSVSTVTKQVATPGVVVRTNVFPHDFEHFKWNMDNFGPVWIPKQGATVKISPENIALFRRIIAVYEGHKLEIRDGKILIDGEAATEYTFQQNYYFMMGDNRHNSEDSRVWGFVPEDHIVGKPLFIWFSRKAGVGIRWDRIFTSANVM